MGFKETLIARIPWMFILLGVAFLGFGRKSAKWQAGGGELPAPVIPIILIVIGVGILIYRKFIAKK